MQIEERVERGITLWTVTAIIGDRCYRVRQELSVHLNELGDPLYFVRIQTRRADNEQPDRFWPSRTHLGEIAIYPICGPVTLERAISAMAKFVDVDIEEDRATVACAA